MNDKSPSNKASFFYLVNGMRHSIGITVEDVAYSWGHSTVLGPNWWNATPHSHPNVPVRRRTLKMHCSHHVRKYYKIFPLWLFYKDTTKKS
jgi:hypothetical protein